MQLKAHWPAPSQISSGAQLAPQSPQFRGSTSASTQSWSHSRSPVGHRGAGVPPCPPTRSTEPPWPPSPGWPPWLLPPSVASPPAPLLDVVQPPSAVRHASSAMALVESSVAFFIRISRAGSSPARCRTNTSTAVRRFRQGSQAFLEKECTLRNAMSSNDAKVPALAKVLQRHAPRPLVAGSRCMGVANTSGCAGNASVARVPRWEMRSLPS